MVPKSQALKQKNESKKERKKDEEFTWPIVIHVT
jgi:hypothetical protein